MVGHEEGLGIVRAGGILVPLSLEEVFKFCLEIKVIVVHLLIVQLTLINLSLKEYIEI